MWLLPGGDAMIPLTEPALDGNELDYVADCIHTGWISSKGPYVQRFETAMADFCGVRDAVAVSSGTTALHLALLALGVGPGDEVIVPAFSYVAPANAVVYTGARPVFVDVAYSNWNLDLSQIEHRITPRTKAVIAVHSYGYPVKMDTLMGIAAERGLWVVEDACEAHGARFEGRPVGGVGHIACFSFYGSKLITTGEGGMLTTNAADLAATARSLRNQASVGRSYWHARVGFSYRLTNLQAALGLAQLERVEQFIEARRRIRRLYDELLGDTPGLVLRAEPQWSRGVCWLYSLLAEPEFGVSRDKVMACLARQGIESRPFFKPLPSLPFYESERSYPVAEHLSRCGISLPSSLKLEHRDVRYVADTVKQARKWASA
jgi:perosamine synthetase